MALFIFGSCLSALGFAPLFQLLQDVLGKDAAATTEGRAVGHHPKKYVLSVLADGGYVPQIYDDRVRLNRHPRVAPTAFQFADPRVDQLTLENQRSSVIAVYRRDLQHDVLGFD